MVSEGTRGGGGRSCRRRSLFSQVRADNVERTRYGHFNVCPRQAYRYTRLIKDARTRFPIDIDQVRMMSYFYVGDITSNAIQGAGMSGEVE